MKKKGILNSNLSRIVASMGHTDKLVICDVGLPIPKGCEVVDLSLTFNIPRFLDTLKVILDELSVEKAIIAEEMVTVSNGIYEKTAGLLPDIPIDRIPHEDFKKLTAEGCNTFFVRTGEATPYANIMLFSGISFG